MSIIDRAIFLRHTIERLATQLNDIDALANVELFPAWESGKAYIADDRVRYEGVLYKVLQPHTSHEAYPPDITVSLYAEVLNPDPSVINDWKQPESTNPYMTGDKVRHNGYIWISTMDYNVFEPGVAGWEAVA